MYLFIINGSGSGVEGKGQHECDFQPLNWEIHLKTIKR